MSENPLCSICGHYIAENEYAIPDADGALAHEACVQEEAEGEMP